MSAQEFRGRVAILGLGTMGGGIARRLLEKNFTVDVWDRALAKAGELSGNGATAHPTAAQAVSQADVVITMLPNDAAVDEVMLGSGALHSLRKDATWVQMGTIGLEATQRLGAEAARLRPDVSFVDAPVSGSREPARTGHLTVFASGPDQAKPAVSPIFHAISERTLWLGAAGAGSRMKLAMNTLLAFEVEAMAEVRGLASKLDIPYTTLVGALTGSSLASAFEMLKLAKMQSGDDSADFALEWALKDVDLSVSAAGAEVLPIASAIAQRWHGLVDQGYGRLDVSAARLGVEPTPKGAVA